MSPKARRIDVFLWSAQIVLALLFLFAGGMKLVLPLASLEQGPIQLPGMFLRFIGVAELLGGLGLVLPGLFRIHRQLTPLAAAGLVIIMIGATVVTALGGAWLGALFPLSVGGLALIVCIARGGVANAFAPWSVRSIPHLRNA